MGKKWKEMGEYEKSKRYSEIGRSLGVRDSNWTDIPGGVGGKAYNAYHKKEAYEQRVKDTIANDYDTRRALEAAALAGDGKAKKIAQGDFSKGKIMNKAFEFMGKPDDPSDYGPKYMREVEAERKAQDEGYAEQFASQDFLNEKLKELEDKFKTQEREEEVEYTESDELKAAKERLAGSNEGSYGGDIFGNGAGTKSEDPTTAFRKANESAEKLDESEVAAGSYLDQYKKDVIAGGNIKEAKRHNLENATNTVIKPLI